MTSNNPSQKNTIRLSIQHDRVMCEFQGPQANRINQLWSTTTLPFSGIPSAYSISRDEIVKKVQECNPDCEISWFGGVL